MRLPTKWLINNSIPATAARLRKFSSAIEFMRIAGTVFEVLMRGHLSSGLFSRHLREVARRIDFRPHRARRKGTGAQGVRIGGTDCPLIGLPQSM